MSKDQEYFDPRRAADQQVEDIKAVIDEAVKEQEEKEEAQANIERGQKIVAALGTLFISPLILMFVWNLFIPGMFGLPVLGYWTSMGLIVISRVLFPKND